MTVIDEQLHRFTRDEYHHMFEAGVFRNKRVELLEGRILDMSPQNEPHVSAVSKLARFLNKHLPERYQLRCQAPVSTDMYSEPEPNFAVVPAPVQPPVDHPETALLAIEVSDTTLARDRRKAVIYAAAGVKEYWIVNIQSRVVEQYTQPQRGVEANFASRKVVNEGESVQCTVLPLPQLPVKDCFA